MSKNLTKSCTNPNCKQNNPQLIKMFSKNKTQQDGFNGRCKPCEKERQSAYQKTEQGKSVIARGCKKYQQTNKGKTAQKRYAQTPTGKISRANADKRNRQTPKGKATHNAIAAKYRASKLQATPPWLTEERNKETKDFYIKSIELTKETGIKHHVDHIFPLQGETISGLHVPWNLQILTQSENDQKLNKFDFTYDNESWRSK